MTTHFIESTLDRHGITVCYYFICGKTLPHWDLEGKATIDPRKVTYPTCLQKMQNYKENMMLSLVLQDFGTSQCAGRFRSI